MTGLVQESTTLRLVLPRIQPMYPPMLLLPIKMRSTPSFSAKSVMVAKGLRENVLRRRYDFTIEKNIGRLSEFYRDFAKLRV